MNTVMVGGITPEGEYLLKRYLNEFMPDIKIEPVKISGVKGVIKNKASRPDVVLLIIDENIYNTCSGVADDVLHAPKTHKYTTDEGLEQFLISKFGVLKDSSPSVVPPDQLPQEQTGVVYTVQEEEESLAVQYNGNTDTEKITELETKLAQSELLVRNLTLQLKDGSDDTTELVGRIKELEAELELEKEKTSNLGEENYATLGKIAKAEQVLEEYNTLKAQLKQSLDDKSQLEYEKTTLEGQITGLTNEISILRDSIAEKEIETNDTITNLNSIISSKDEELLTLSALKTDLTEKTQEIERLNTELAESSEYNTSLSLMQETLEEKETELNTLTTKITELEGTISTKDEELSSLNTKLLELESALTTKDEELSNLNTKLTEQESAITQDIVDKLIEDKNEYEEKYTNTELERLDLEEKYNKERSETARLISEIETLKKINDTDKVSELRLEIARLKKELSTQSDINIEDLKQEVSALREKNTRLELDIADKTEIEKELTEGVFGEMANTSYAKSVINVDLKLQYRPSNKFFCIASGNGDSTISLYRLLAKSIVKNTLLIDLTTESYSDVELGVLQASSPVSWLEGRDPIDRYIVNTKLPNLKVATVSLAYLNDLYLLRAEWGKLIQDIDRLPFDSIILNVGNLSNTISKILFNNFIKYMRSGVVVKASPVNLRITMLNLHGLQNITHNNIISCVDFISVSKGLYERLASKYNAQILSGVDKLLI